MRLLLLHHLPPGTPTDAYLSELRAQDVDVVSVRPETGAPLPSPAGFDGILATGGPVSVYDEPRNPWLREEKRFIADAVRSGLPFWGVCLGAQLLAAALDGEVGPGPRPAIGVTEISLTPAGLRDPVFGACPSSFPSFEWHRDGLELPQGAVRLATSSLFPNQAFSWGSAYGVQFHLETTVETTAHWLSKPAYERSESDLLARRAELLQDVTAIAPEANELARGLIARWLDGIRQGGPAPLPSAR